MPTTPLGPTVPEADGGPEPARGALVDRFLVLGSLGSGGMGVVLLAYDPELDRKVALKMLHAGGAGAAREPLVGEAQAMARLAHPNVVAVHEIGATEAAAFVVMEYVEGQTLRAWLRAAPRGWREVVAMFLGAGAGLAAAHAAGIVHRDFKPENVLVGADGRPRVADFGLASMPDLDFAGTVEYMAPEQLAGAPADARSDQFAFAVALWEGLYGERPFAGGGLDALRAAVAAGPREPPRRRGVPDRLRAALTRALAADPARRWPSLDELLAELRRDRARRSTWIAAAAAVLAAAAALALVARTRPAAADPCPAPADRVAAIWGPERRAAVEHHVVAVDPALGARRFAAAAPVFERSLAAFGAMQVEACRATRIEGRQSDRLLDARTRCLDEWASGVDGVAADLERAKDPRAVEGAIRGFAALPPLSSCADAVALLAEVPPPTDPAARAEAEAILAAAKELKAARRTGHLEGLPERADALIVRARKLGFAPALTRALDVRWRLAVTRGDIARAVDMLREVVEVAARAHDDDEVAKGFSLMVRLTGMFQNHPDEARALMPAARAACARAGDPPALRAEVLANEALALSTAGATDAALDDLAEARGLLEAAGAALPGSPQALTLVEVLHFTGSAYEYRDDYERALAPLRRAIEIDEQALGPDSNNSTSPRLDLAQSLALGGHLEEAEAQARIVVRIREANTPDSPVMASALALLADALGREGRHDEAVATAERAVAMARTHLSPDDATRATLVAVLGDQHARAGHLPAAIAAYDEVLATVQRTKMASTNVADWWLARGDLARRSGRCPEAIEDYRKGSAAGAQIEGPDSHYVGRALRDEATCLHELHRDADARVALERGLAGKATDGEAESIQQARALLSQLTATTASGSTSR